MNAERQTPSSLKKSSVLGKLEEENDLTPSVPVRRHMHFGYSYVRPAGEANVPAQKLAQWIADCGVSNLIEFENILAIFQQDGLISKFVFSQQDQMLKLEFPDNFAKLASAYRKKMFGDSKSMTGALSAEISYDSTAGDGAVNGVPFKLKDGSPEYVVFRQLYSRIGKKIERDEVLRLAGFYKDYQEPDPARRISEGETINEVAKNLRKKTGLNTKQLVLNNGNLTLKGRRLRP